MHAPSKLWAQKRTPLLNEEIIRREVEAQGRNGDFYRWRLNGEKWRFMCVVVWDDIALEGKLKPASEAAAIFMK